MPTPIISSPMWIQKAWKLWGIGSSPDINKTRTKPSPITKSPLVISTPPLNALDDCANIVRIRKSLVGILANNCVYTHAFYNILFDSFFHCFYPSLFNLPIIYSNHCQVSQQEKYIFFRHTDYPQQLLLVSPTTRLPLLSIRARNNCTGFTTGTQNTAVGYD